MATADQEYLSVSALTQYIKRKFDVDPYLDQVYLRGEISNFRLRPHNHQYFSLKDDHAKISAIMFRSDFEKVKFTPETGTSVLVVGRISLYEPTGNYQIYVQQMIPDGIGELYLAYEQLKQKLTQEGLFGQEKRPLVRFPKRIAVITSPSGAVIRDIMTTVQRRYPIAQLVLFPAVVQGDSAAASLVARLEQVNQSSDFDTIIIGRGGGSIEDLWPFNEEQVVRAVAASKIPIISSVGHETDTTLSDLAADVRAATPTAAAELATPVLSETLLQIEQDRTRLLQAFRHRIKLSTQRLSRIQNSYVMKQPQRLYENYLQRLDLARTGLMRSMIDQWRRQNQQYQNDVQRLEQIHLDRRLTQTLDQLWQLRQRLSAAVKRIMVQKAQQVQVQIQSLDHLSPLKILGRGYSYTMKEDKILSSVQQVQTGTVIDVHLADGVLLAKVQEIKKDAKS